MHYSALYSLHSKYISVFQHISAKAVNRSELMCVCDMTSNHTANLATFS